MHRPTATRGLPVLLLMIAVLQILTGSAGADESEDDASCRGSERAYRGSSFEVREERGFCAVRDARGNTVALSGKSGWYDGVHLLENGECRVGTYGRGDGA